MSKEDQTLIRFINGGFTTLSNKPLQDKRLSLEARGLIASVLSFPQDWSFNRTWAQREFKVGRDKLDRILTELKDAGYMRFIQRRGEGGKLEKGVYYLSADPAAFDDFEPLPAFQGSGDDRDTGLPEAVDPAPGESAPIQKKLTPKETHLESAQARDEISLPEKRWRDRLIQYRKRAIWAPKWGPPMHSPGCLVPPALVQLWDDTAGKAFTDEPQRPEQRRTWQRTSVAIN